MSSDLDLMEPLTWLKGTWKGKGKASFPTHKTYDFEDEMKFNFQASAFEKEPLIQFEEIAWVLDAGEREFKHWETGYFKPEADRSIQFYICHNTGRIEVTYGRFSQLNTDSRTFTAVFESQSIRNDIGTTVALTSLRELTFKDDTLTYTLEMSTEEVPEKKQHLIVTLNKCEG